MNKNPLDQAIEAMNQAIIPVKDVNKVIDKAIERAETGLQEIVDRTIEPVQEVRPVGRPIKMTEEMKAKVIELAEEYFFIRSIAGKAGISYKTLERYLSEKENEDFVLSFTHARDKWIADKQNKLETYATTKSVNDWRAMQYLLTIADKEYSERKYLTEAVANQDAKILMLIKAEKLTIASKQGKEMLETVITTPLQGQEAISLLPFKPEDPKNKGKAKTVKNKGQNGSRPPYQ